MSTISPDDVATGAPDDHRPDPADLATRPGATELEAVTGPLPVVDPPGGHLHITARRGVTIVSLDGGLDHDLASTVVPSLADVVSTAHAVVLELDQVTLLDRGALDVVLGALDRPPADVARCLVAGRLTGRLVLERWDVPRRFAVFHSVADALQAREFETSGYGDGWRPGP